MQRINDRVYKSIYFKDGLSGNRKRRDVTVAFSRDGDLYDKCKDMKSSEIKELIGIESYEALQKKAQSEKLKLSSYIKKQLITQLLS